MCLMNRFTSFTLSSSPSSGAFTAFAAFAEFEELEELEELSELDCIVGRFSRPTVYRPKSRLRRRMFPSLA